MVTDCDLAWLIRRERNRDLLREAEQVRLARQAMAGQPARGRAFTRALAWLGRRLVAWGRHLQERYSALLETPAWSATDHGR